MYVSSNDPKEMLLRSIENGKSLHDHTCKLSLPPLIASPDELWGFQWPEASPNFITQKEVLKFPTSVKKNELSGKIVCIPNADPGFDWLFSRSISGLVTTWGGANSHMAIRAVNSLCRLPSALEKLPSRKYPGDRVHLDCKGKRIEVLQLKKESLKSASRHYPKSRGRMLRIKNTIFRKNWLYVMPCPKFIS